MRLADRLNQYNTQPEVTKGEVELSPYPSNLDDLCDSEGTVTDPEFLKYFDWLETLGAYLDEHPYGREGGYVPTVQELDENDNFDKAWWDENDGLWQNKNRR